MAASLLTDDKPKHTPGPWTIFDDDCLNGMPFIPVEALHRRHVCEVNSTLNDSDDFEIVEEDRANARLIAAAPELLVALRDCAAELGMIHHVAADVDHAEAHSAAFKAARAAIRLALTGER